MRTASFLSLFALAVAGCSSSSDDGPATPTVVIKPDTAITVDNAIAVARAGVRGAFDPMRLAYIGANFLRQPKPEVPDPNAPGTFANVLSKEYEGPAGGVCTFTWEDKQQDGIYTTGDIFTINFDAYGDEGMVLDGVMIIDDVRLQGPVPSDGTWLIDATINCVSLHVQQGAQDATLNVELPFRFENRIILEIFELFLFEDLFFGAFEVKQNTRYLRYESDETLRYAVEGNVWSPEFEGIVRFETRGFLDASPFLSDPTAGVLYVRGLGRSVVEIEPNCIVPGVCFSLDVRVDEDGDEVYEDTLSTSWSGLLPQ